MSGAQQLFWIGLAGAAGAVLRYHGAYYKAGANVLANLALCLTATWLGILATRALH